MLPMYRPHYHSCENPPASSPYQHSHSTILNGPNHSMPDPHNSSFQNTRPPSHNKLITPSSPQNAVPTKPNQTKENLDTNLPTTQLHSKNQHPLYPHTITPPSIPSQNSPRDPQPH
ncbi:hypothetical protein M758_2G088900 [Ceratodon purpureus]|nr:hypothetical protein M758_2G088900 [Ceratodon purpureus]